MIGIKHIILNYINMDSRVSIVLLLNLLFFFLLIKTALFLFHSNTSYKNFLSRNKSFNYVFSFSLFGLFILGQLLFFLVFSWYHEYILTFIMLVVTGIFLFSYWKNRINKNNNLLIFGKLINFFMVLIIWYLFKILLKNALVGIADIFVVFVAFIMYFVIIYFFFWVVNKNYLLLKRKIKFLIMSHFGIEIQGIYLLNDEGILIKPINKFIDLFFNFELYDAVLVEQIETVVSESNKSEDSDNYNGLILNFILFLLGQKVSLERKPNKFLTTEINGWNIKLVE